MSFLDCIATAVEAKKLTQGKADEVAEAYQQAIEDGKAEGLTDEVAEARAPMRALEETTDLKKAERWFKVNEMRKQHALYEQIKAAPKPVGRVFSVLDDIMDQTDLTFKNIQAQLMALMPQVLDKFQPRLAGLRKPIENMDNLIRGLYDESVPGEVTPMVEAVKAVVKQSSKLLNLEGAHIRNTEHYRFPQSHDRFLVRQTDKAQWVGDHLAEGVLDWDVMEYAGKTIPVDNRQAVLEAVYDGIVSEGRNRGIAGGGSFAERISRERFLYYANADAWLDMQGKYGTGDFYHQLIQHIDATARHVSLMRTLGPEPVRGKVFAEQALGKRVGDLQVAKPDGAARLELNLKNAKDRFQAQYDIHSRNINTGQGDMLVAGLNTARSMIGTALLGNVVVASFSDAFFGMWGRMIQGMPSWHVIPNYVDAIAHSKNATRQMIDDGIIYESAISMAVEGQRYNVALEGAGIARTLSEFNYRAQGAAGWTQTGRGIAGQDLQKALARVRHLPFDQVPFVDVMRNLGITERDWGHMRDAQLYEPEFYSFGKGQFLRPIDMVENAVGDEGRSAASKFMMLQEAFVRDLVPAATLRTRQAVGQHVPVTSVAGQLLRTSSQLMLFPASIMFNHWRKIWAAPRIQDKLFRMGTFMAYTTVSGAMQAQIKDMLMGRNPDPIPTRDNILRWAAMGGGGAIIGDWIFQNLDTANSYYSASTPVGEELRKLKSLAWDNPKKMLEGDPNTHWGKDATESVWGLVPKPVPYKLLLERGIHDSVLEWADPAAYQRKLVNQQAHQTETGQTTWWGVGEEPH